MTPQELSADLRTRINPAYANQRGTESYERRICSEAIEWLIAENASIDADRRDMFIELESLKAKVYDASPCTIGHVGTACGEYVECTGRPDAPHGVDLEASFRIGRTVCVCKSWAPGEAS